MSTIPVDAIKVDDIVTIQVSGGFYARLHQLLQSMSLRVKPEDFNRAIQSIKAGKADSEYAYHLETLTILIKEIETSAKDQGKISKIDVDPEKLK